MVETYQKTGSHEDQASPESAQKTQEKVGDGRPHMQPEIDLSNYEAESGNEYSPIRYFVDKQTGQRVVRINQPDGIPPVLVEIPERPAHPELLEKILTWENIQHLVMLDANGLWMLGELAARYNRRQPLIVEGDPAVSKTFMVWVFACIVEQAYIRKNFSANSKESTFLGSMQPGGEYEFNFPLKHILHAKTTEALRNKIQEKLSNNQEISEREEQILLALDVIDEAKQADIPDEELMVEAMMLGNLLGLQILDKAKYSWVDDEFVVGLEHGAIVALDEPNLVRDSAVSDRLLPAAEVHNNKFPMPSQRRQGDVTIHNNFWLVSTQNQLKHRGRHEQSGPFKSRHEHLMIPGLTERYVRNVLEFFLTGNDPEIMINGKLVRARTDVQTEQRGFMKDMPYRDLVINAIAKIHTQLVELINDGEIGSDPLEGGNYEVDQRDIAALLDAIIEIIQNRHFVEQGDYLTRKEPTWSFVVKEAMRQVYITGMIPEDAEKVMEMIEDNPIWGTLEQVDRNVPTYVGLGVDGQANEQDGTFTPDW